MSSYSVKLCERARLGGLDSHIAFLDIRKAYDTVSHECLWKRLLDIGVNGKMWRKIFTRLWWHGDCGRGPHGVVCVKFGCVARVYLISFTYSYFCGGTFATVEKEHGVTSSRSLNNKPSAICGRSRSVCK